ncbi:unnamed protein product [Protopolystoma xenopodis]|uniref:Uncharacterized protein n=1 Tax=Protopolystoma xenopodis TaxID=117903 RepID=A0A3S5A1G2_9PLAT|nr:unnamed protein product [Protopolystoma xenopodis]
MSSGYCDVCQASREEATAWVFPWSKDSHPSNPIFSVQWKLCADEVSAYRSTLSLRHEDDSVNASGRTQGATVSSEPDPAARPLRPDSAPKASFLVDDLTSRRTACTRLGELSLGPKRNVEGEIAFFENSYNADYKEKHVDRPPKYQPKHTALHCLTPFTQVSVYRSDFASPSSGRREEGRVKMDQTKLPVIASPTRPKPRQFGEAARKRPALSSDTTYQLAYMRREPKPDPLPRQIRQLAHEYKIVKQASWPNR